MPLPKSFRLANRKWKVKLVSRKTLVRKLAAWEDVDAENLDGLADPNTAIIYVANDLPPDMTSHTFYHELVHALKYARGEIDHDEVEVDGLGALLHQFILTVKEE